MSYKIGQLSYKIVQLSYFVLLNVAPPDELEKLAKQALNSLTLGMDVQDAKLLVKFKLSYFSSFHQKIRQMGPMSNMTKYDKM